MEKGQPSGLALFVSGFALDPITGQEYRHARSGKGAALRCAWPYGHYRPCLTLRVAAMRSHDRLRGMIHAAQSHQGMRARLRLSGTVSAAERAHCLQGKAAEQAEPQAGKTQ
jgi:hypothetical protein